MVLILYKPLKKTIKNEKLTLNRCRNSVNLRKPDCFAAGTVQKVKSTKER